MFFLSCSFINPDTTVRRHKTLQHPLFLSMIFINCISHLSEKIALSHRCTICTWCPFIFRRPICGAHGILLGLHPRLGRSPISARGSGKQKNPPLVSPSLKSFFLPLFFFPPLSLFGPQTELNQQLHTPDAPIHRTIDTFWCMCGGWGVLRQAEARVTEKSNTTMVLVSFPPFSDPHHPPFCPLSLHSPLSCPLLCSFCLFLFHEFSAKNLVVFTLMMSSWLKQQQYTQEKLQCSDVFGVYFGRYHSLFGVNQALARGAGSD